MENLEKVLNKEGFRTKIRPICGGSLRDQVWWKRWVVTASKTEERPFGWVTADDEPCTPPLTGYPLEWVLEDGQVEKDTWEEGLLTTEARFVHALPWGHKTQTGGNHHQVLGRSGARLGSTQATSRSA